MSFAEDTLNHIRDVKKVLSEFSRELERRGKWHDYSKFSDEEQKFFTNVLDGQKTVKYGTPEYEEIKRKLAPALEHHYRENRHHPEHFINGINDMTLIDLMEMVADWNAATKRHEKDNISNSIEINSKKYNIDKQLKQILLNTVEEIS